MTKLLKIFLFFNISIFILSCSPNIEERARIISEFKTALKTGDLELAKSKITELSKDAINIDDLRILLLLEKAEFNEARNLIENCNLVTCEDLLKKINISEYEYILEGGIQKHEYKYYVDYFFQNHNKRNKNKDDLCNAFNSIEHSDVQSKINDKILYAKILKNRILAAAKTAYSNMFNYVGNQAEHTSIGAQNGFQLENRPISNNDNSMIFQLTQIHGYELGHKMGETYIEPRNLAQMGVMGSRYSFRSNNESACDFIKRSMIESNVSYSNYVELANGKKSYFNISGVELNSNVVFYHAINSSL